MEICSAIIGTSQRGTKHEKIQMRAICLWLLVIVIMVIMCINYITLLSYTVIAEL